MQKQGLQTKDPKSDGKEAKGGSEGILGTPREQRRSARESLRAPEVSREASPEEVMSRERSRQLRVRGCAGLKETKTKTKTKTKLRLSKFKDTAKALGLSLSLGLRGWKFKGKLETRNALVPKGMVADIYIYIYIYIHAREASCACAQKKLCACVHRSSVCVCRQRPHL